MVRELDKELNQSQSPEPILSESQLSARGLKALLKRLFPLPITYAKSWRLLFKRDSALVTMGWFKSHLQGHPSHADGSPLPWMNYGIIHFLETRLTPDLRLFEYGSGYSTLFFGSRVAEVTAIEHDADWHRVIEPRTAANTKVLYQALDYDGDYCRAVSRSGKNYDIVVVDGRDRARCAVHSSESLSERGVIIWDDSQRPKYQAGIKHLLELGFRQLEFRGLKPIDYTEGYTSIFYRPGNCLGI